MLIELSDHDVGLRLSAERRKEGCLDGNVSDCREVLRNFGNATGES